MLDEATIARFQAGDEDALRLVYREFGPMVHAIAWRVVGDRGLAEEATQQTFVRAWQAAGRFDLDRPLGPWLATIARRAALDLHRREARRPSRPLDEADGRTGALVSPPPSLDRAYDAWEVRRAVLELPRDEEEVVRLQHLEGLTHAEIADRLEVPMGTVKSRSHRAHRRLAGRLGHLREVSG